MTRTTTRIACTLLAGAALAFWVTPGFAQNADLNTRVQRLERDLRDLQMEVYRGAPPPSGEGGITAAPVMGMDLLRQRIDDIEAGLRRVTGQLEELSYRIDRLAESQERLQRDLEFQAQNLTAAMQAPPADAEAGEGEEGLAPGPRPLGSLPAGTDLPTIEEPLDGALASDEAQQQEEFDAAMELLIQAQYGSARQAFRAFEQNYPGTELGAQALYWTGDVAYSIDKDFEAAARDFAELLRDYPDSNRAPEGMLKLGLSLLALGQNQEGCAALAALPAKYPNAGATIINRARAERQNARCN